MCRRFSSKLNDEVHIHDLPAYLCSKVPSVAAHVKPRKSGPTWIGGGARGHAFGFGEVAASALLGLLRLLGLPLAIGLSLRS